MAEIIRSDGARVLIDDDDLELVSIFQWHPTGDHGQYVGTHMPGIKGKAIRLHRLLLNAPDGVDVDHINRDPLDNRRANLRFVTPAQNNQNVGISKANTTGFRGVYRRSDRNHQTRPYEARVRVNGRKQYFGTYATAEEAGAAAANARAHFMTHAEECPLVTECTPIAETNVTFCAEGAICTLRTAPTYTHPLLSEWVRLRKEGCTYDAIAKATGSSLMTVNRWVRKALVEEEVPQW